MQFKYINYLFIILRDMIKPNLKKTATGAFILTTGLVLTACSSDTTTNNSNSSENNTSNNYKDGTYTASGTYQTPETKEEITVTLSIKDNTVSSVSIEADSNERESREYIARFKSGISGEIVGDKVDSISLTRVNGSSLTPKGFMVALNSIKSQAKI